MGTMYITVNLLSLLKTVKYYDTKWTKQIIIFLTSQKR